MEYDVTAKDDTVMVSVPGRLLHDLLSLSQGYTQSQGRWLSKSHVQSEVKQLLFEQGYEIWGPTLLTYDHTTNGFAPREDLTDA